MKVELEPAYILHTRAYRETSLLVEALSLSHGRIGLIYQGGRTARASRLASFNALRLSWQGKGDLYRLTRIEDAARPAVFSPLQRICGLYLNELLLRLTTRNSPVDGLFDLYHSTLEALASQRSIELVLRQFECRLLDVTGYGMQLEYDADTGQALEPDKWYCYAVDRGPCESSKNTDVWNCVQGQTLMALATNDDLQDEMLRQAKRLMRGVLDYHLQGRPLKSREIFKYLKS